jgi:hypothetical protein
VIDLPQQSLQDLVSAYGQSLCDDPRRCEALLRDLCGEHRRAIHILVSALRERVAADLLAPRVGVPTELLVRRLTQRLCDNVALAEDDAKWAVESWALALGVPDVSVSGDGDRQAACERTSSVREDGVRPPTARAEAAPTVFKGRVGQVTTGTNRFDKPYARVRLYNKHIKLGTWITTWSTVFASDKRIEDAVALQKYQDVSIEIAKGSAKMDRSGEWQAEWKARLNSNCSTVPSEDPTEQKGVIRRFFSWLF